MHTLRAVISPGRGDPAVAIGLEVALEQHESKLIDMLGSRSGCMENLSSIYWLQLVRPEGDLWRYISRKLKRFG